VADSRHHPIEQVARALRVELAEPQRVEDGDRASPEGKDVAQDPADASGRALERLHRARVVVGLDLERHGPAVADADRARVLAWPHQDLRALCRQPAQELARVLVRAVLGPEQREHRQLDLVWLTAGELDDALVFGVGEPELAVSRLRDRHRSSITSVHVAFQAAAASAPFPGPMC
jgi:hypothetical protein